MVQKPFQLFFLPFLRNRKLCLAEDTLFQCAGTHRMFGMRNSEGWGKLLFPLLSWGHLCICQGWAGQPVEMESQPELSCLLLLSPRPEGTYLLKRGAFEGFSPSSSTSAQDPLGIESYLFFPVLEQGLVLGCGLVDTVFSREGPLPSQWDIREVSL